MHHNICSKRITNPKEIKSTQKSPQGLPDQYSMPYVLRSIRNEPERVWTFTELYEICISKVARGTSHIYFLNSLEEKLAKNYCILKGSGLAAICIHKEKVSSIFKVTSVIDDPDKEMIMKVAKMIEVDIA